MASAIFAFREQPKTFLVYNAKEVKNYLIQHDKYREDGYVKVDKVKYRTQRQVGDITPLLYHK